MADPTRPGVLSDPGQWVTANGGFGVGAGEGDGLALGLGEGLGLGLGASAAAVDEGVGLGSGVATIAGPHEAIMPMITKRSTTRMTIGALSSLVSDVEDSTRSPACSRRLDE